jgi:hypothetical protein
MQILRVLFKDFRLVLSSTEIVFLPFSEQTEIADIETVYNFKGARASSFFTISTFTLDSYTVFNRGIFQG